MKKLENLKYELKDLMNDIFYSARGIYRCGDYTYDYFDDAFKDNDYEQKLEKVISENDWSVDDMKERLQELKLEQEILIQKIKEEEDDS